MCGRRNQPHTQNKREAHLLAKSSGRWTIILDCPRHNQSLRATAQGGKDFGEPGPRLVGKEYKEADPKELVTIDKFGNPWTKDAGSKFDLTGYTAEAFRALRAEGMEAGHDISIASAHRSSERQQKLFERAVKEHGSEAEARKWVAQTSEHSTGRAIDFDLGLPLSSNLAKSGAFEKVPAYQWLRGAAPQFGFTPYRREPWHWSYNPR